MGDVYAGAVCTIASTGSPSGDGGCYHQRVPESLGPCTIGFSSFDEEASKSIFIRRDEAFHFERQVDRAPLNKRAWVLQEQLLSRRILHFGAEMMYWECQYRSFRRSTHVATYTRNTPTTLRTIAPQSYSVLSLALMSSVSRNKADGRLG